MIAVRAATIFLFLFSSLGTLAHAQELAGYSDVQAAIVLPMKPNPNASFELVTSLGIEQVTDPKVTGSDRPVTLCVIRLTPQFGSMTEVPVDEYGNKLILDNDGMTWQTADQLLDGVDPDSCRWIYDLMKEIVS